MRRYLYPIKKGEASLPVKEFDVIVVGSGIAGLYAALHLDASKKVAVITKTDLDGSNSWMAQGGIAAVLTKEDNFTLHVEDTITAGAGLCKKEAVQVLVEEGPQAIHTLEEWEVPFDYDESGELILGREGGHRLRRIAHCDGDATGRETTKRLGQIVAEKQNISVFFKTYLCDIVTDETGAAGVIAFDEEAKAYSLFSARNIIVATGGIGQLYEHTTNPVGAVGDGIACLLRAGAKCANMEMVQFHPTTLMAEEVEGRLFLISEAVRGEGAVLRNASGEAFMQGKHPMADLAPRDIVTRHILKELRRTGEDRAYLDCSGMTEEFFSRRFPNIYAQCKKLGIHLTRDFIPIHPAQHYFMGGIETDLNGSTCVPGLFACGEVSCTGVHGANRLASNSMLECLVFGKRCAETINRSFRAAKGKIQFCDPAPNQTKISAEELEKDRALLKKTLSFAFGPVRHFSEMEEGLRVIEALFEKYDAVSCTGQRCMELCNMTLVAREIARAALAHRESQGAHYIED